MITFTTLYKYFAFQSMDYDIYRAKVEELGLRKLKKGDPKALDALECDSDNGTEITDALFEVAQTKIEELHSKYHEHLAQPSHHDQSANFDEGRLEKKLSSFVRSLIIQFRYWLDHWRGGVPGVINTDCHIHQGKVRIFGVCSGAATLETT